MKPLKNEHLKSITPQAESFKLLIGRNLFKLLLGGASVWREKGQVGSSDGLNASMPVPLPAPETPVHEEQLYEQPLLK